jgi:hypothetical protein
MLTWLDVVRVGVLSALLGIGVALAEPLRTNVSVESDPPGATVYVDDATDSPVGTTPWRGTLAPGAHTIVLRAVGYVKATRKVTLGDDLIALRVVMALCHVEWVEVRANVPAAEVYIDGTELGAVGRTPYQANLSTGKHTIVVKKDGYTAYQREIDVEPCVSISIDARLEKLGR